jgi:hypothetical protein
MPTADRSNNTRSQHISQRTLAYWKIQNPVGPEQGPHQGTDESIREERRSGGLRYVYRNSGGGVEQETQIGLLPPTGVTNLTAYITGTDSPYNIDTVSWTSDPVATSYVITISDPSGFVFSQTDSEAIVYYINDPTIITVTAVNSAGSASVSVTAEACFLAGAQVAMADGTTKAIETVAIGDSVVGAFGELNPVVALQRVYLGMSKMYKINGEHDTTDHHPHVSIDKKFYTPLPGVINGSVYGKSYPVITADGDAVRKLEGLAPGRVQVLNTGVELKTIDGSRVVNTLERYSMPFDTELYNLVVGGSHTYHVNGYAVTGWPSERDFDYDAWAPKEVPE